MLRILLLCAVVVLVAGGGAAGWWFGLRGEPFPFPSAQASEGEPSEAPASGEFVELDPLTFPVMRNGEVRELVTYVVQLEVADDAAETAVKAREPAVRDAMLSELHGLYAYRFVHERADKMDLVKRRLRAAAKRASDVEVQAVLLKGLSNRPQQAERP
jgi:flagellar basal body-associated protein FliL